MERSTLFLIMFLLFPLTVFSQQKTVGECTIKYVLMPENSLDSEIVDALKNSIRMVYLKDEDYRDEMINNDFSQAVIFNGKTKDHIVLRSIGKTKLLSKLNESDWKRMNDSESVVNIKYSTEYKSILGYQCEKAEILLKDGEKCTLFYTKSLIPTVKGFEFQYKEIPGLVLQFDISNNNNKRISYIAKKIDFDPLPLKLFLEPKEGYKRL